MDCSIRRDNRVARIQKRIEVEARAVRALHSAMMLNMDLRVVVEVEDNATEGTVD